MQQLGLCPVVDYLINHMLKPLRKVATPMIARTCATMQPHNPRAPIQRTLSSNPQSGHLSKLLPLAITRQDTTRDLKLQGSFLMYGETNPDQVHVGAERDQEADNLAVHNCAGWTL